VTGAAPRAGASVQGSYDPANALAFIDIAPIHDRMLKEET
jgi:hypothetical protein